MAVARSGTCACPLFRPAIILSVLPLESRSSRTFQARPSDPRLTDRARQPPRRPGGWQPPTRKIPFKILRQIILKMTANRDVDDYCRDTAVDRLVPTASPTGRAFAFLCRSRSFLTVYGFRRSHDRSRSRSERGPVTSTFPDRVPDSHVNLPNHICIIVRMSVVT
jgi:hypothetical protein